MKENITWSNLNGKSDSPIVFSINNMNGISEDSKKYYSINNMNGISYDADKHFSITNMNGMSNRR